MGKQNEITTFTLTNSHGMQAVISNYGGIILSLHVPDHNGNLTDVALGYDNLADYQQDTLFFGALIGRYANRIANAQFSLHNITYKLAKNDGDNHLHGGEAGFHRVTWQPHLVTSTDVTNLQLRHISKDGAENYPGNLDITVTYTITEHNELRIEYYAVADQDTIVNLTNHSYFNLAGHDAGDISDHQLKINAKHYTPITAACIPTGTIANVSNTPFDFTEFTRIGKHINSEHEQIQNGQGYDHNFVLIAPDGESRQLKHAATVYEPQSGRVMEVLTTKPGMQFYSGNFIKPGTIGKNQAVYNQRSGFCLETQFYPNSPNQHNFPTPVLPAGTVYNHTTIYRFSNR